ncbi:MAG: helix-turn-helix transcriptional regulator [Bacteroidota bacterium]
MSKRFTDTATAAAYFADDDEVQQLVQEEISQSELATLLTSLRLRRDIKQKDVAKSLNRTASNLSKLESGNDDSWTWPLIRDYAMAVKFNPILLFEPIDAPASELIKFHVFEIRNRLEELKQLAVKLGTEDDITKQINEFYGEVLFNFLAKFEEAYEGFPRSSGRARQPQHQAHTENPAPLPMAAFVTE